MPPADHREPGVRRAARVPSVARWLAERLVPEPHREFLLGDLEEQYTSAARAGRRGARGRYWRQALRAIGAAWSLGSPVPRPPTQGRIAMSSWLHDLRISLRTVWRSPGYSAVSVLTLALAIGANTLLFSLANPLVVRPLPLDRPETLGWILLEHAERGITRGRSSLPDFLEWRASLQGFAALAAYGARQETLLGHGEATRVLVAHATANLPEIWGIRPVAGRQLQAGEDAPGRERVGVLAHRYWQAAFGGAPDVLGRTFLLGGQPVTVVGVMPPSIELGTLALIDIWTPLVLDPAAPRDDRWLLPVGRLEAGVSIAAASAELESVFARQVREHPDTFDGWRAAVQPTRQALAGSNTWVILALLGIVVGFVLLIACANLANLVLARIVARRRELDMRFALGASRWRVVRPWMLEGGVLSAAGGVLGLAIAYGGLRLINAVAFEPYLRDLGMDRYVLTFTLVITVATPLLFAVWPALSAGRASDTLHGARVGAGRGAALRRNLLVGGQVALALSLLIVSALAVQSMLFISRTDMGYDPRPLLTWGASLPSDRYVDAEARARYVVDAEAALAASPGVRGAAFASGLPVIDPDSPRPLSGTREDGLLERERPWAAWFSVSPGFFHTVGIPVLTGRGFADGDRAGARPVAVISRMAADRYFDGAGSAVGRRLVIHDATTGSREVTIVGVVGDTRDNQLLSTSPQVYVPLGQWPVTTLAGIARSDEPLAAAPSVRVALRDLDPDVAISDLKPLSQTIRELLSSNAILNGLFIAFAVLALVLAAAGLFGVISYSVGERRREFGIRLALGAAPRSLGGMVVWEGLRVTLVGAAAGLLLALALARLGASILFGISPTDPRTFGGATAIVLLVALAAAWSPARRATRVDPARTLRAD